MPISGRMNVSNAASTRPGRTIQIRNNANRGKKAAIRADRMNILNLLGTTGLARSTFRTRHYRVAR
jgi:hypothetical protein